MRGLPPRYRAPDGEDGSGMIGTIVGATIFLGFLFMAVQVVLYLFATSVATNAAVEAARFASAEGPGGASGAGYASGGADEAEAYGLSLLGDFDPGASLDVEPIGTDIMRATVRVESPLVFGPLLQAVPGMGTIERSVDYRLEGRV